MANRKQALNVVVFSCSDLGVEVSNGLRSVPGVQSVSLITAPYRRKQLTLVGKIRHVHRTQGWWGLASVVAHKLLPFLSREKDWDPDLAFQLDPSIQHFYFGDFHDSACLEAIRKLRPDLGVIAGTYILKESVFAAPRLGSINLHTGKAPEYRGAPPVFWELFNGESCVGITIHRVVAGVDAGNILMQELFPLENAPGGDPLAYIKSYHRQVLLPNAVRMLAATVARIAEGTVEERPQNHGKATTYRTPDYKTVCELRQRVKQRRKELSA